MWWSSGHSLRNRPIVATYVRARAEPTANGPSPTQPTRPPDVPRGETVVDADGLAPVRQVLAEREERRSGEADDDGDQEGVHRLAAQRPEHEPEHEGGRRPQGHPHEARQSSRRVGGQAARAAAIAPTTSPTAAAGSSDSVAARTSRLPTMTPSA